YIGVGVYFTDFWEYNAFAVVLNLKFFIQDYYITGGSMKNVIYNDAVINNSSLNYVDTVTVELHNTTSPYATVETYKGLLKTDGTIVCPFSCNALGNSYYIAVRHRSAVETWSAAPVSFTATTSYD